MSRAALKNNEGRNAVGTSNLTIWGRANSVNVQKVLWCAEELGLSYQRIDAGMAFGRNTEPDYLTMNPNGRVPTLVDGDFVLWESNSIMRYFALTYGQGSPIYPDASKARAAVDRWLDWTLSTLQPVDRPVFWALVRTPPEKRDMIAIQKDADAEAVVWQIPDTQLATRQFIEPFESRILRAFTDDQIIFASADRGSLHLDSLEGALS